METATIKRISFFMLALYILPAVVVAFLGPGYETKYEGMSADPPELTIWALRNYHYTFAFILGSIPAILIMVSNRINKLTIKVCISCSSIILTAYAIWLFFIWYGLEYPLMILRSVAK